MSKNPSYNIDSDLFRMFSIKESKLIYITINDEEELSCFSDLLGIVDDKLFTCEEICKHAKIHSFDEFENSVFREWKDSWLLFEEEIKYEKILFCAKEIKNNILNAESEDIFFNWLFESDENNDILFCMSGEILYCKDEIGLYSQGRIGYFLGYFKDIMHPPVVEEFKIKKRYSGYAYFAVDKSLSSDRSKFLKTMLKKQKRIEKAEKEAEYYRLKTEELKLKLNQIS